jgi:ABC-type multidrug transport system fused ATPase/permease subunit
MSQQPQSQQETKKPAAPEAPLDYRPTFRTGGPGPGAGRPGGMGTGTFGKAQTKNPRGVLWRWIFSYLRPHWIKYAAYFCLLIVASVVTAILPRITLNIINNAILTRDTTTLFRLVILYVSLTAFNGGITYIAQYGMNRIGQVVVREVRKNLFYQLQSMSMAYFDKHLSGDILSIMTNDVDQLNLLLSGQLVLLINNFVQLGLFLLMMYLISPILATLALINFPLFLYMTRRFQMKAEAAFKLTRRTISRVTSSIQENIAGAKVVQAYGQEKKAAKEFDEANQANAAATVRVRRTFATFFTSVNYVTSLTTAGIIFAGGIFYIDQISLLGITISIGTLVAYISYLNQLNAPLLSFSQIQQTIESAMAASDRIYSLTKERVELLDPETPVPLTNVRGEIDFKDVNFGYILEEQAQQGQAPPAGAPQAALRVVTQGGPAAGAPRGGTQGVWQGAAQGGGPPAGMNPAWLAQGQAFMENLPEPYKSFIQSNIGRFPPELRRSIFMNLMGLDPSEVPAKLDEMFGEIHHAVPGTDYANEHPDYETEFEELTSGGIPIGNAPAGAPSGPPAGMNPAWLAQGRAFMESLPEPYKTFMLSNIGRLPPELRRDIFMNLTSMDPSEVPAKLDEMLGETHHAVSGTEFATAHPDYETEFPEPAGGTQAGFGGGMPPEAMLQMAKTIERALKSQASGSGVGGGMGGGGEGMGGGGGMPPAAAAGMVQALARMTIPPETFRQFPAVVRKAIEEQRTLIEHAESVGYVLEHLNLHIDAGATIGVVGETGAGKTTLIKLIARFYDVNEGEIDIDGVNVRAILKRDLRRMIGLVPQDSFMFKGSIRENLLYGIKEPSDSDEAKMIEASKFLGLHNFVMTLPEEYDTVIVENASNLSIGQRQLMAFARALITDPKILILDEATSSVDPYTETLIQDALDRARAGRTTIIIAHRLSTIKNADHIIVISRDVHGIIEEGTHDELMAIEDGHYRRLVELQSQRFGEAEQ